MNESHSILFKKKAKTTPLRHKFNYAIYSLIFCFGLILFFQFHPNSNEEFQPEETPNTPKETDFYFFDQFGEKYNIFAKDIHGAAQNREYLNEEIADETIEKLKTLPDDEENEEGEEEHYSGAIEGFFTTLREKISNSNQTYTPEDQEEEKKEEKSESESEEKELVGKRYRDIGRYLLKEPPNIDVKSKEVGVHIIKSYKSCKTPRGYTIDHGESVVAYKQDPNSYDDCNLERRYCYDGKLSGTFKEKSCKVNTKYTYYQKTFVAYHTNEKSDIIQPEKQPLYTEENYPTNKHGVEEVLDREPVHEHTDYSKSESTLSKEKPEVEQETFHHSNCVAPRGEKVKHGQFVKAYRHKNGFNDYPCEVQIRLCTNGTLEGTYQNDYCMHRNTSYLDRLDGYPNRESLAGQKITGKKLEYILSLRKQETEYQKEEVGHFKTPLRDQLLDFLDQES